LSHIPGGTIAKAYFRPQLPHELEFDTDTIGTRNCRLAALRIFFGFVAGREPAAIAQCTEILRISD
jgi:hypothetical protein